MTPSGIATEVAQPVRQVRLSNSRHVAVIDGLRAFAVLSVLVSHTGKHDLGEPTASFLTRCSQLGGHGVELFFVISGFCLAMPYLRTYRQSGLSGFDGPKFFAARIVRILPPYYVAVAGLALLSFLPLWRAAASQEQGLTAHLTRTSLLAHLVFAQRDWELLNGSFWTLRIEAIWYLLFPLLLVAYVRSRAAFFVLGAAFAVVAYLHVFHDPFGTVYKMTLALPAFMLGIFAADMQIRRIGSRPWLWTILVISTVVAIPADFAWAPWARLFWALGAFSLVALANCDPIAQRVFRLRVAVAIGIASYSIYLIHEPVISLLEYLHVAPPLALIAGLASGFAFWWAVERPLLSDGFRRPLVARLRGAFALLAPRRSSHAAGTVGRLQEGEA